METQRSGWWVAGIIAGVIVALVGSREATAATCTTPPLLSPPGTLVFCSLANVDPFSSVQVDIDIVDEQGGVPMTTETTQTAAPSQTVFLRYFVTEEDESRFHLCRFRVQGANIFGVQVRAVMSVLLTLPPNISSIVLNLAVPAECDQPAH